MRNLKWNPGSLVDHFRIKKDRPRSERCCPKHRGLRLEHLEERALLDITGLISGTLFEDLDRDGVYDQEDLGLQDWTIELQPIGEEGTLVQAFQDPSRWSSLQFGSSVAAHGDDILVAAAPDGEAGAVYLFDSSTGLLLHTFEDPEPGGTFGASLVASGNRVYIGDPHEDIGAEVDAGVVHVFEFSGSTWSYQGDFRGGTPNAYDYFGGALALAGDELLVSASGDGDGTVYLLDENGAVEQSFLNPTSDPTSAFGASLAADGNSILVGAPMDNTAGTRAGAAFVFDRATGTVEQQFFGPGSYSSDFGRSVTLLDGNAFVGAPLMHLGAIPAGTVEVYSTATGNLLQTMVNPDRTTNDVGDFGRFVGTMGGDLLVSDSYCGWDSVYRFQTDGVTATRTGQFDNPSETGGGEFGYGFAPLGNNLVVGSPAATVGSFQPGAVYVFDTTTGDHLETFHNPVETNENEFGESIAAVGDKILVGVPGYDDEGSIPESGIAYLMDSETGEILLAISQDPTDGSSDPIAGDRLGYCVAAAGDNLLITAPGRDVNNVENAGIVYLFDGDTGNLLQSFTKPGQLHEDDQFGHSITVLGDYVLIGAPHEGADDAGAAYLFNLDGTHVKTFSNPSSANGDRFGWSLATQGDNILIGAPFDDNSGVDAGAVYLYPHDSETGYPDAPTLTFEKLFPSEGDLFGWSIASTGDQVFVSARDDDTAADNAGAVYSFDATTGNLKHSFMPPAPTANDGFGYCTVATQGDKVLITMSSREHLIGDLNNDGLVGGDDLDIVRAYLGQNVPPADPAADPSGDDFVGGDDMDIVRGCWGDYVPAHTGTAYLFDATSGGLLSTFSNPRTAPYEFFGMSAAALENNIFIGTPSSTAGDTGSGAVYLFDAGTVTTTTDNSGYYAFDDLGPGKYRVRLDLSPGCTQTAPDGRLLSYVVTLAEGESFSGLDFGCHENSPPVANNDSYSGMEDEFLTVLSEDGVLANDGDLYGGIPIVHLLTSTSEGTLRLGSDGAFTYWPNADYYGHDEFMYTVTVRGAESSPATVSIDLTSVNDAPIAEPDAEYTVNEDGHLEINAAGGVLANDSDVDGDPLSAVRVHGPWHGMLDLESDGSFVYVPDEDFTGIDYFSYQATDGLQESCVVFVNVEVLDQNDLPVAEDDAFAVVEDGMLSISAKAGLLLNDYDADGDALNATMVAQPAHGSITAWGSDGSFTYVPNAHFAGTDSFTYRVNDGTGDSTELATVAIHVVSLLDPPVGQDDTYSIVEDTNLEVDGLGIPSVLDNDISPDGAMLAALLVEEPSHGILSAFHEDGTFTYIPEADFNGTDTFMYVALDGAFRSEIVTVTIIVQDSSDAPVAVDDAYEVDQGNSLTVSAVGVLANDYDPDGDVLGGVILQEGPDPDTYDSFVLNADGSFVFVPKATFVGTASFSYLATANGQNSDVAFVTITVVDHNDTLDSAIPAFLTGTNQEYTGIIGDGHNDDSDVDIYQVSLDADQQVIAAVDTDALAAGGSSSILDACLRLFDSAGNELAFVDDSVDFETGFASINPSLAFTATEAGTYYVAVSGYSNYQYDPTQESGRAGGSTGDYQLWLRRNTAPVGNDDSSFNVDEEGVLVVTTPGILENDTDTEGDDLKAVLKEGPSHGNLIFNDDGSFTYTPNSDYSGEDTFTYTVCDGFMESGISATVTIEVDSINDLPIAVEDFYRMAPHGQLEIDTDHGVLANDSDVDDGTIHANLTTAPEHGQLTLLQDGSFTYTPDSGFYGVEQFEYTVHDGTADGNTATVTIHVVEPPGGKAVDDAYTLSEDTNLTVHAYQGVLANDDEDTWTVSLLAGPYHGVLDLDEEDGAFTYTPFGNFAGIDRFFYQIDNGDGISGSAEVALVVEALNDSPTLTGSLCYEITVGNQLTIPRHVLLSGADDVDGDVLHVRIDTEPEHGTLGSGPEGEIIYTPNPGTFSAFPETDSFSYKVSDGTAASGAVTVEVEVHNEAPVASDISYYLHEDQTLVVLADWGVLGNDSDADGHHLSGIIQSLPSNGVLSCAVEDGGQWIAGEPYTLGDSFDGSFAFTPDSGQTGTVNFTYSATDGFLSDTATATIHLLDTRLIANSERYTTPHDVTLQVTADGLLSNDWDALGDLELTAVKVSDPTGGTLSLNADGSFTFTPDPSWDGTANFTYKVSADDGGTTIYSDPRTVTITVTSEAPHASEDRYELHQGTADFQVDGINIPSVTSNDFDPDGAQDTATITILDGVDHGTLTPDVDGDGQWRSGTFSYTPDEGFSGEDSFTYKLTDGDGKDSQAVTVTLAVQNSAPHAGDDGIFFVKHGTSLVMDVEDMLQNDSDADEDALAVSLVTQPIHGTVTLNYDGDVLASFTYTPNTADYVGLDGFTYQVFDGAAYSGTALVRIRVWNNTPEAAGDSYMVHHSDTLSVDTVELGVLGNDVDWDLDALTAELVTGIDDNRLTWNADGTFSFDPDKNNPWDGNNVTFEYRVTDGVHASEVIPVNILVTNTEPEGQNDNYNFSPGTTLIVNTEAGLLSNDYDPDDELVATLVSGPSSGQLTLNPDGSFIYVPDSPSVTADVFTYHVSDGAVQQSYFVFLTATNTAPVAMNDTYTMHHGDTIVLDVLGNDFDKEGDEIAVDYQTAPTHGSITNVDGRLTYTPGRVWADDLLDFVDFVGEATFTYQARDSYYNLSESTTVTIIVENNPPVARDDQYLITHDNELTLDAEEGLLVNDYDLDLDSLIITIEDSVDHGTLILLDEEGEELGAYDDWTSGAFRYIPSPDFSGADSFTYQISDGALEGTSTAVVEFTVTNSPPWTTGDYYTLAENSCLTVDAQGVLANDGDAEEDALVIELVDGVEHGILTLLGLDGSPLETGEAWTSGAFHYEPSADFVGTDAFTYRVSDGIGHGQVVAVTLDVLDDMVFAVGDFYSVTHDTAITSTDFGEEPDDIGPEVLANDTVGDETASLEAVLVSNPEHALNFQFHDDGTFDYIPLAGFVGTDYFTYLAQVEGGSSSSDPVVVRIHITNTLPQAEDDEFTVTEDSTDNVLDVLGNDTDAEEDLLSVSILCAPNHGELAINPDGTFSYTPNEDYMGADTFLYEVTDGLGMADVGLCTLTVEGENDPPLFEDTTQRLQSVTANEDLILRYHELLDGVHDAEDDELSVNIVAQPSHGDVTVTGDGDMIYTPTADYLGTDMFSYKVSDGVADSQTILVEVTVGNHAPVAEDISYSAYVAQPMIVPLSAGALANDYDLDNHSLTATIVQTVDRGTLDSDPDGDGAFDGSFVYTPDSGAQTDYDTTFTYVVNDGFEDSAVATVTLHVTVNRVVASDNRYTTLHDTPLSVDSRLGVLYNDWEQVDDLPLTAHLVDYSGSGSLTLNADGSFVYTPPSGATGSDQFTYRAKAVIDETDVYSEPRTVYITLTNTAPVAEGDAFSVHQGEPLAIGLEFGVLANDYDSDGDEVAITVTQDVAHGTLEYVLENGQWHSGAFIYTPEAGYHGADSFTYVLADGAGAASMPVTVSIDVRNNAPVASDNTGYSVHHGDTLTIDNENDGVYADDYDFDGDSLTVEIVQGVSHGELNFDAETGTFTYAPDASTEFDNFVGTDFFQYRLHDGCQYSETATVAIDVWNNVPWTNSDIYAIHQGETLTGQNVLANDSDWDGDDCTVELVSDVTEGILVLNPNGTFEYAPGQTDGKNFSGSETFTYRVFDGAQRSALATVTVHVRNHVPQAFDDHYITDFGQVVSGGVLDNDWDFDEDSLTVSSVNTTGITGGSLTFGGSATPPSDWDGHFVYTPNTGFSGTERFSYTVFDGSATTRGYVDIIVKEEHPYSFDDSVPDAGDLVHAVNDIYRVLLGETLSIIPEEGVLANDWLRGSERSITLMEGPDHGTLELNNTDGSFTYSPDPNHVGEETFTYSVTVGGDSDSATATIYVTRMLPQGNDVRFTNGTEGTPWSMSIADLLAEAFPDTSMLDLSTFDIPGDNSVRQRMCWAVVNGSNVEVKLDESNYANFHGDVSFDYTIKDIHGNYCIFMDGSGSETGMGRVTIEVASVDDAASAVDDDSVEVLWNSTVVIDLLCNDYDLGDGWLNPDTTDIALEPCLYGGSVEDLGDGLVEYTPPSDSIYGFDQFSYTILGDTSESNSDTANVVVSIHGKANEAPTVSDMSISTDEDTPVTFSLANLDYEIHYDGFVDDTWDDNGHRYFEIIHGPEHGTIENFLRWYGSGDYVPDADWYGTDSFTFIAYDDYWKSSLEQTGGEPVTFTITVAPQNDLPVTRPDYTICSASQGSTVMVDALANDFDPENEAIAYGDVWIQEGHENEGNVSVVNGKILFELEVESENARSLLVHYTVRDDSGGMGYSSVYIGIRGTENNPPMDDVVIGSEPYFNILAGVTVTNTGYDLIASFKPGGVGLDRTNDRYPTDAPNELGAIVTSALDWSSVAWNAHVWINETLTLVGDGSLSNVGLNVDGSVSLEFWDNIKGTISARNVSVTSTLGDINTIEASGHIDKVVAGRDIKGNITAVQGIGSVEQQDLQQVVRGVEAGRDVLGDIETDCGDILKVDAGRNIGGEEEDDVIEITAPGSVGSVTADRDLNANIRVNIGDIESVTAGQSILSNEIRTEAGRVGTVHADWNIESSIIAGAGGVGTIAAGNDITSTNITSRGDIDEITAGRDLGKMGGTQITADGMISSLRANRDLTADILGSQGIEGSIIVRRNLLGDLVSEGAISRVRVGQDIGQVDGPSVTISAGGSIGSWVERSLGSGTIDVFVAVGAGRNISGTIESLGGTIGEVVAGTPLISGKEIHTSGGSIINTTIHAHEDIEKVLAKQDGAYGNIVATTIESDTGSIGNIAAGGRIHASIIAAHDIAAGGSIASGGDAYGGGCGGSIRGSITSTDGNIGFIDANHGDMAADVRAAMDISGVRAIGGDVTGNITARYSVAEVETTTGSITGNIEAKKGSIGNVKAFLDIRGSIVAETDIGSILAGRNIGSGAGSSRIVAQTGTIDNITAGYVFNGNAYLYGSIHANIKAGTNVGPVTANGFIPGGGFNTSMIPERDGDWPPSEEDIQEENIQYVGELDESPYAGPALRRLAPPLSCTGGDIQGSIIAGGSITSVTAYGDITNTIAAGTTLGTVWALGDIASSANLSAGCDEIICNTWGNFDASVEHEGDITVKAWGDVSQAITSERGVISITTWGNLAGKQTSEKPMDIWVCGNVSSTIESKADVNLKVMGGLVAAEVISRGLIQTHYAREIDDCTFSSLLGQPIILAAAGDISDVTVNACRSDLLPEEVRNFWNSPFGYVYVHAGGDIDKISATGSLGVRMVAWGNISGTAVIDEDAVEMLASFPGGLLDQFGSMTISALGNVDMDRAIAHHLLAVESDAISGAFKGKLVSIDASGPADGGILVEAVGDVCMKVNGSIHGTITSKETKVEIKNTGDITGTVNGARSVGIESWGSGGISGNIVSPGVDDQVGTGRIEINAFGPVNGVIEARNTVDIITWGDLDGSVTTEKGYAQVFAAGSINANVTSGGFATLETWGDLTGSVRSGPETLPPGDDFEYEVGIRSLGNVTNTIRSLHHVGIDASGAVSGNIIAEHGRAIVVADAGVDNITITAHDDVDVVGWGIDGNVGINNLIVDATSNGGTGKVSMESGSNAIIKSITAKNDVEVFANGDLEVVVLLQAEEKSVDLFALEKLQKAQVTAPAGNISIFAGSDAANIDINGSPIPATIEITTLGTLNTIQAQAAETLEVFASGEITNLEATTTSATSRLEIQSGGSITGTARSGNRLQVFGAGSMTGKYESGTEAAAVEGDATVIAMGPLTGEVKAARDAEITSYSLEGAVEAGRNADVSTMQTLRGTVSALDGSADVYVIDGDLIGTVDATTSDPEVVANASVFVGQNILGKITAKDDATVSSQNDFLGEVTANDGSASVNASGSLLGAIHAGGDASVYGNTITATITAANKINVLAGDTIVGSIHSTGGDATVVAGGPLVAPVTAMNVEATSFDNILGPISASTGDAIVRSGSNILGNISASGNVTISALDDILGTVTAAAGNVKADIGRNSMGSINAGGNASVVVQRNVMKPITAGNNLDVTAAGSILANMTATDGDATIVAAGNLFGNVTANALDDENMNAGNASVTLTGDGGVLSGNVDTEHHADVLAMGQLNGNVTSGANASVSAWTGLHGNVTAGNNATVWSGGNMQGEVYAGATSYTKGNAHITTYGTAILEAVLAGENVTIDAIGALSVPLAAALGDFTLTGLGDVVGTCFAAQGTLEINVLGWLGGYYQAANADAFITAGQNFTGTVNAARDASVVALENISATNVSAGHRAEVAAWGAVADVHVEGDEAAWLFSYHDLLGTVTSSAGTADAFSRGLGFVTADAATTASVVSLGDLQTWVTAGAQATILSVGNLDAHVISSGDVTAVSYAEASLDVNALNDVTVASVGDMEAYVNAGHDAWAISYDDMELVLMALNNVQMVGSLGHLTGTIEAGNYVRRAMSYRDIDALIVAGRAGAGDDDYGVLDVIEAWESIDGQLTASTLIGNVRAGGAVLANLNAPAVGTVSEHDHAVRGLVPEVPQAGDAAIRAWLDGQYRVLVFARQDSLDLKEGLLVQKGAVGADLREMLRLRTPDRREAEASREDAKSKLAADVRAIEEADRQALQRGKTSFVAGNRQAEADLKQARNDARNRLHDAGKELANRRQQREDEQAYAADQCEEMRSHKADDRENILYVYQDVENTRAADWKVYYSNVIKNGFTVAVDTFQLGLDFIGLYPVYGEWADGLNGTISFVRGNRVDAAISFASMLPLLGDTAKMGKLKKLGRLGNWLTDAAKYSDGAKVFKNYDNVFPVVARRVDDMPGCFVAGTQVVMAESPKAAAPANPSVAVHPAGPGWLYSAVILGAGLAGYTSLKRQRRRQEDRDRDAAIDALFNDGTAWDMPEESELDQAAEAVAARGRLAGAREAAVAAKIWECDDWQPNRATSRAVLDRPVAKRTIKPEPESKTMPIRRWKATRRPQIPQTRPRRNWLGLTVLGVSVLLAGLVGFGSSDNVSPSNSTSSSLAVSTTPLTPAGPWTKNIEEVRLGERTAGRNPRQMEVEAGLVEPDPETWRELRLRMRKQDGGLLSIGLLRSLEWIEALDAKAGGTIHLDLPEMGAVGPAEVLSVGPCPPIQAGVGNLVTGTFHHEAGNVIDLFVEGADEPLGCTANHRYWSEDRQEYVAAGALRPGERLWSRTLGHTRVVSITPRAHRESVYNLEVHGEHVFEVSEAGVLVHNNCMSLGKMTTIMLGDNYLDTGRKAGLRYTDSIVYILRDSRTGELLKVGETARWESRLRSYSRIGIQDLRELEVDVFHIHSITSQKERIALENQIRDYLTALGHKLPWDNFQRRLGRPGLGIPTF